MKPLLSILICSLHSRIGMLGQLLRELQRQVDELNAQDKVEILVNSDNKEKTTGRKRQELLEQAKGKRIVFIDDDDWVAESYIAEVLRGCETDADVIAINGWYEENGKNRVDWETSAWYDNVTIFRNGKKMFLRTCNHICPAKRELALRAGFPDKSNGEDKYYMERLKPLIKSEYKVTPQLYFYRFSTHNKEYK